MFFFSWAALWILQTDMWGVCFSNVFGFFLGGGWFSLIRCPLTRCIPTVSKLVFWWTREWSARIHTGGLYSNSCQLRPWCPKPTGKEMGIADPCFVAHIGTSNSSYCGETTRSAHSATSAPAFYHPWWSFPRGLLLGQLLDYQVMHFVLFFLFGFRLSSKWVCQIFVEDLCWASCVIHCSLHLTFLPLLRTKKTWWSEQITLLHQFVA